MFILLGAAPVRKDLLYISKTLREVMIHEPLRDLYIVTINNELQLVC